MVESITVGGQAISLSPLGMLLGLDAGPKFSLSTSPSLFASIGPQERHSASHPVTAADFNSPSVLGRQALCGENRHGRLDS